MKPPESLIACCGLNCGQCGAYLATRDNDDDLRKQVAAEWTVKYNTPIAPEDIHCTGCRQVGIKFNYAAHGCEIRPCCINRGHDTCADCDDYPCEKVEVLHAHVPQAKAALDDLRK